MHVCLTCIEMFGDSIHGGFGRATRFIARELARRGEQVTVVVPRRSESRPDDYELDGFAVRQYRPGQPWDAVRKFRECRADIYHSQDTSTGMVFARLAAPKAIHVVTFRDPMDRLDWKVETDHAGMPRIGWNLYRGFIDNPWVTHAVRKADARFCAAEFLIPKTTRLYGLATPPRFLASPVDIPASVEKAVRPTVCYVGRWEGRKRVELFFELARECPEIEFIAMGGARDPGSDQALREKHRAIPNLRMPGVLDQFRDPEWSRTLGRSWILANTSLREGLPTTFVEAAAHRCAILSFADPDGFASRFGAVAGEGALRNGLMELLHADRWRGLGEKGWQFVSRSFATEKAIDAHLAAYRELLRARASNLGRSR